MTSYGILIGLSLTVIFSYLFHLASRATRVPSVLLLLLIGVKAGGLGWGKVISASQQIEPVDALVYFLLRTSWFVNKVRSGLRMFGLPHHCSY